MKYLSLCIACLSTGLAAQEATFYEASGQVVIRHSDGLIESRKAPKDGLIQVTNSLSNGGVNVRVIDQTTTHSKRYIVQLTEPSLSVIKRKNILLGNNNNASTLSAKQEQTLELALTRQSNVINRQQDSLLSAAKQKGIEYKLIDRNRRLLNTLVIELAPEDTDAIKSLPGVKQVFEDKKVRANLDKSVPLIGATQLWQQLDKNGKAITGQGVKVAVLDTGVDYTHSSLGGCLGVDCKVIDGYDFTSNSSDPMDVHGHGTHVASTIAGDSSEIKGVAPDAKIYAYKVLSDDGEGHISDVVAGIERAVDPDGNPATNDSVDIINMSLGGPGTPDDPLSQASNAAFMEGVLVVAAAGNDYNYQTVDSPALAQHVLAVGATDDADIPASFTSKGPATDTHYIKPEISAPGVNIYAAAPGENHASHSGTSMASPHVAGAAALLMQVKPELSVSQIKSQLISGVKVLDYEPYIVGSGRLDISQSVTNDIILDTPTLFLGNVDTDGDFWTVNKPFILTNTSSESRTLSVTTDNLPAHANITLSSSSFTLAAGESKAIMAKISVDISKLEFRNVGVGAWYFNIEITGDGNQLTLPVVYEHNRQVTLTMDGTVEAVSIYDPETFEHINTFIMNGAPSASLKLTRDKATFKFDVNAYYSPLTDFNDYPADSVVFRNGYVFKPDIELSANTNLSVSIDELKYKLNVGEFIHNDAPFNYAGTEALGGKYVLAFNGNPFEYITSLIVCSNICSNFYPQEFHFSELPEGFSVFMEDYYIDKSDETNIDYFLATRSYDGVSQSVSESIDTGLLANPSWHYQAPEGESATLQTNNWVHSDKHTSEPITINTYTTNKPSSIFHGAGFTLLKYQSDIEWYNFSKLAQTGYWEANENNTISIRTNQTLGKEDYQAYKTLSADDINISQSLRYWSANTSFQGNTMIFGNANGYPLFRTDHSLVRDANLNKFYTDNQFNYLVSCNNGQEYLNRWANLFYWYNDDDAKFHLNDGVCIPYQFEYSNYFNGVEQTATATFHYNSDGSVPGIQYMSVTQQDKIVESVSRIANELTLEVQSENDDVSNVDIYMQYDGSDQWLVIYGGAGTGTHTTSIPLTSETRAISLKIELTGENGNKFVNIIPKALKVGANVNGDNDADSDGIPNDQDTDNDNDGIPNVEDPAEYDPVPQTDNDNDGIIDARDTDDDNDQIPDSIEIANGLDPLSAADATADADNDGLSNLQEYQLGTDINDRDSDGDGVSDGQEVDLGRNPLLADPKFSTQDFNGDGFGDILYRDNETHEWQVQTINGTSAPISENISNMSAYAFWEFQGTGDFNADGKSDILIRHKDSGSWYVYLMDGAQISLRGSMSVDQNLALKIQAIADFNSDGYSDLLLRDTQTGEWQIALLDYRKVKQYVPLPIMTKASSWEVATVQDMDNDGNIDILIRNNNSGSFYIYMFDGTDIVYRRSVKDISPGGGNAIEKEEQIVAIADFDGDKKPDVLVRSELYNHYRLTLMDGYQSKGAFHFDLPLPFEDLNFVAADDFTSDGLTDFILSRDKGDTEELYLMQSIGGVPIYMGPLSQEKRPSQIPQRLQ